MKDIDEKSMLSLPPQPSARALKLMKLSSKLVSSWSCSFVAVDVDVTVSAVEADAVGPFNKSRS